MTALLLLALAWLVYANIDTGNAPSRQQPPWNRNRKR